MAAYDNPSRSIKVHAISFTKTEVEEGDIRQLSPSGVECDWVLCPKGAYAIGESNVEFPSEGEPFGFVLEEATRIDVANLDQIWIAPDASGTAAVQFNFLYAPSASD